MTRDEDNIDDKYLDMIMMRTILMEMKTIRNMIMMRTIPKPGAHPRWGSGPSSASPPTIPSSRSFRFRPVNWLLYSFYMISIILSIENPVVYW